MRWIRVVIFLMLASFGEMEEKDEPVKLDSSNDEDKPSEVVIANDKHDRREPIDIDGKIFQVSERNFALLISGNGNGEKAVLINTGYSVEVRLAQDTTNLIISGKAVRNNLFVYTRTIFYWAKTADGVAGTTIHGKNGTALEISVLYYNTKYKSYVDALKHRDGILEIRIRVNTNSDEDNPKFEPFAKILEKILNPESVETTLNESNSWYLKIEATTYYVYAGSVKNVTTGETKPCSITVVVEYELKISLSQFEIFSRIENSQNKELVTAQKSYPSDNRIIVHTTENLLVRDIISDERSITSRYM